MHKLCGSMVSALAMQANCTSSIPATIVTANLFLSAALEHVLTRVSLSFNAMVIKRFDQTTSSLSQQLYCNGNVEIHHNEFPLQ